MNPLEALPPEVVLRILDFSAISSIACLSRVTKSWHEFIENTHQEAIFSSYSKTPHPTGSHDLSFLAGTQSFADYFSGTTTWKELCKRETLLARNWNSKTPVTRESVIQVGNDAVWRFRADFKRRFILSTSQQGGFNVTDMDSGNLLWSLPNDRVRGFAHLEYEDGTAVWDREGNAIEVWRTDYAGLPRGIFQRIAILPHDCQTRGFQLSYNTLCVVSTEGQTFTYDLANDTPRKTNHLEIERDAVGHLYQDADVMMISMAKKGYHFHDKASGAFLGALNPDLCREFYHIRHPLQPQNSIVSTGDALSSLPSVSIHPPRNPTKDRLVPIEIERGVLPQPDDSTHIKLESDEWGAGILSGFLMVGISRGGRVFICPDWRSALRDSKSLETNSCLIECDSDGANFDFGGWVSVRDNRIMLEIQDLVYVVALNDDCTVPDSATPHHRPSYGFNLSAAAQLATPVSFMALYDDCIMATYTV